MTSLQFHQNLNSSEKKWDQILLSDRNSNYIFNEYLDAQKQLTRFKSYCWHLESQFEIQIKTVQVLKDEIVTLRNLPPDITDPIFKRSVVDKNRNCLPLVRHLLNYFPKSLRTIDDWRLFCESVERFLRSTRQFKSDDTFDRLQNILRSLISPTDNDGMSLNKLDTTSDKQSTDRFSQVLMLQYDKSMNK